MTTRTPPAPTRAPAPAPVQSPFDSPEALHAATTENPEDVIQLHFDEVEEARIEGKECGKKEGKSTLWKVFTSIEAAAILILLLMLIFGDHKAPNMEKLNTDNLRLQQETAKLNAAIADKGKEISKLESDAKAAVAKTQELESKLALADKSNIDAIKEKQESDTKVAAAEKRATELAELASRGDVYKGQAESVRTELVAAKGELEATKAKLLELEKALALRQQQPLAPQTPVVASVAIPTAAMATGGIELPLTNRISAVRTEKSVPASVVKNDKSVTDGLRRIAAQEKNTRAKAALNGAAEALDAGQFFKGVGDLSIIARGLTTAGFGRDAGIVQKALDAFSAMPPP